MKKGSAMQARTDDDKVSFGFREVDAKDKASMVGEVFSSVASKYDIMNDVMSGGMHRLWKTTFVEQIAPRPGEKFLDVAGGTGDIAFKISKQLSRLDKARAQDITILDINADMLAVGRERASKRGTEENFTWVTGDAMALPIPSGTMDAYSIAFGIRNVTHLDKALSEAYRVLRPGGRFFCLEFSHVDIPALEKIYDAYSFHLIPRFGSMVAGDAESYQYLVESIRRFPNAHDFAEMIKAAGFSRVSTRRLSGGIVAIHTGRRI